MFKFLRYLTVCAVAVSSLAFTACGDDDDDDNQNSTTNNGGTTEAKTIVGTWSLDSKNSETSVAGNVEGVDFVAWKSYSFKADGTFTAIDDKDQIWNGKYTVNGSDLAFTATNEEGTFTIKKGADVAEALFNEDVVDMGLIASMDKQEITVDGDVMTLDQEISMDIDLSIFDEGKQSGVATIHGVYKRK